MGSFILFIDSISVGLYIFIALLFVWNIRAFIMARSELHVAQFGLEREMAQRQGGRSFTLLIIAIELLVFVWAITAFAAPTWRDGLPEDALNLGPVEDFRTSTPSQLGEFNPIPTTGGSDFEIIQTAPPPSTPVGTIIAPGGREGCTVDQAFIQIPGDGQLIFEPIEIIGVANVENFSFYKFELRRDRPGTNFAPIGGDYTQPVLEMGPLGQFIPSNYLNGGYRLRLMVFDSSSMPVASCELSISIDDPVPTETPIGQ
jgi:hypothetical protein